MSMLRYPSRTRVAMCSRYETPSRERMLSAYGVAPDQPYKDQVYPLYMGAFIRARPPESTDDDQPPLEAIAGQFGLLPFWAKDRKLGRSTYNARTETVATKSSFRSAWKASRHAIIPAEAIYEPDWRSGKAVATRITRTDGGLLAIAGLWEEWRGPDGRVLPSFTMLTMSAADHELMRDYHRPDDEKRMLVVLPNGAINDWLHAPMEESMDFVRQYPADRLRATPT